MTDRTVVYSTENGRTAKPRKPKRAAPPPVAGGGVRVRREKKGRGGKEVTVIFGLGGQPHDTKAIAKRLKTRLGTGGAVKNGTIEIQGNHVTQVITLLAEAGIPAKQGGG